MVKFQLSSYQTETGRGWVTSQKNDKKIGFIFCMISLDVFTIRVNIGWFSEKNRTSTGIASFLSFTVLQTGPGWQSKRRADLCERIVGLRRRRGRGGRPQWQQHLHDVFRTRTTPRIGITGPGDHQRILLPALICSRLRGGLQYTLLLSIVMTRTGAGGVGGVRVRLGLS